MSLSMGMYTGLTVITKICFVRLLLAPHCLDGRSAVKKVLHAHGHL